MLFKERLGNVLIALKGGANMEKTETRIFRMPVAFDRSTGTTNARVAEESAQSDPAIRSGGGCQ